MIDDSCEVPRQDLDEGFNPCRKQVVENGELCQYAHMYDVMNERYDREEDTSYLNSVKRDRISQSTPSQSTGGGKIYSQDTNGVEGFISTSGTLEPTANDEIPSSKAVADYAPIPLPISKGGTGGTTPYVTDAFDNSANFVMYDEQNARYNAAPMTSLRGYLDNRYSALVPTKNLSSEADLNELTYGTYYTINSNVSNSLVNKPSHTYISSVRVDHFANGSVDNTKAQLISENLTGTTFYRYAKDNVWYDWVLLYPTTAPSIPNPLPVDQGGTGAQSRNSVVVSASQGIPLLTSGGPDGPINSWTTVEAMGTFFNRTVVNPQIDNAFTTHTATTVADNNLLPTNALMIDYVAAHSLNTPPSPFSYKVAPYPSGTWEGEMTVNVDPVFSVTIGATECIIARVYGSKKFNYNGTADNISLFSSIQIVEEYPYSFQNGTSIPLKLDIHGRSYAAGTFGFNPRGSASDVLLNNQVVSSVLSSANLNMSNSLNCVFGEGTNIPGVNVSFSCLTLMWRNLS